MGEYNFVILVPGWVEWLIAGPILLWRAARYGYSFRLIKLTRGYYAKVDQEDYVRLRCYSWIVSGHKGRGYTLYAQRTVCAGRRRYTRMMHREIVFGINPPSSAFVAKVMKAGRLRRTSPKYEIRLRCASPGQALNPKLFVDHINGDGLDNRRANLRVVTPTQNNWNRRFRRTGRSKFTGVTWDGRRGKWRADIYEKRKKIFLGHFTDEKEAAQAFDAAARERRGKYAVLNFPDSKFND